MTSRETNGRLRGGLWDATDNCQHPVHKGVWVVERPLNARSGPAGRQRTEQSSPSPWPAPEAGPGELVSEVGQVLPGQSPGWGWGDSLKIVGEADFPVCVDSLGQFYLAGALGVCLSCPVMLGVTIPVEWTGEATILLGLRFFSFLSPKLVLFPHGE